MDAVASLDILFIKKSTLQLFILEFKCNCKYLKIFSKVKPYFAPTQASKGMNPIEEVSNSLLSIITQCVSGISIWVENNIRT